MTINRPEAIAFLKNFDFKNLFLESLGWSRANDSRTLTYNDQKFTFDAFAQQKGVTAYACQVADISKLDYRTRNQIERVAAPNFPSHLFVFFDGETMVWQWSRREIGQPRQVRSVGPFRKDSSFEPIIQKLDVLKFDIENDNVQATDVDQRLKQAFNVEPVTKKFYKEFEQEYNDFLNAIMGIAKECKREFASLMLNRLMFLYFMQSKGFLLDDKDYLKNKFDDKSARVAGCDDYLSGFLAPLFFEVLSVKEPDRATNYKATFGKLLYLNGGLFSRREWEKSGEIRIPDAAFEKIFTFFRKWQWQLDERPTREGNEINPDVLGYVFERFINDQAKMGAYYTKEDITGYISRNTILPLLWEKAGLDSQRPLDLLRANLPRYVYPAVKHGCELDLPADIAAGIGDVSKRGGWNTTATPDLGLPTEIWREVVARRARYEALTIGQIKFEGVADLITHNLDISQWFADMVADLIEPKELERLWTALEEITVLDPTVGSGAFLFAAMGVLGPVYEACLERMDGFISEADARAHKQAFVAAPAFDLFRATLHEIEKHLNRNYTIYKKLTVGNLFGVDIMPEATEICKLRLFLKLAAQVSPDKSADNWGIEPLPDIDFNIRAGNTLVGFARASEVEASSKTQNNFGATWDEIETQMREYGEKLEEFRDIQLRGKGVASKVKDELNDKRDKLVKKLNLFNAGQYEMVPLEEPALYAAWKANHQPFHWCAEFYNVMQNGGFDVIIGNPPYLEQREIEYKPKGFETFSTGAVHAMCIERACQVIKKYGTMSMIVPLSLVSTQRMKIVQDMLEEDSSVWYSNFAWRPGKLFDTVNRALTIFVALPGKRVYTTGYQMWASEARDDVMFKMDFRSGEQRPASWIPKLQSPLETSILGKCLGVSTIVSHFVSKTPNNIFYRTDGGLYWKVFTDFAPAFNINGKKGSSSRETTFSVREKSHVRPMIAALSSDVFWWWYSVTSNLRHLNPFDIQNFPVPEAALNDPKLAKVADRYIADLKKNSTMLERNQKQTGKTATQSFKIQKSKPIINEIDRVLAGHYGFTDEELDFIINYDIKYRMGREAGDEE